LLVSFLSVMNERRPWAGRCSFVTFQVGQMASTSRRQRRKQLLNKRAAGRFGVWERKKLYGRSVAMDEKMKRRKKRRKIVVSQHTPPSQFSIKKHFPAPILHYPQPTKNRSQRSRFPIPTTCVFSQGSTASEDNRWKSNRH